MSDTVPKELDTGLCKAAFLLLHAQNIITHDLEHFAQVLKILLHATAIDDNIVQINHHKLIKIRVEQLIHKRVKCCWSVCQTKRLNQPLKSSLPSDASHLWLITFGNLNLIIALPQIYLGEHFGLPQMIKQLNN